MAVKGNFSALQQQRESNVDFTKGILDATNIYLKMQENRRAEEEHVERKDLYKQKKNELLRNAINGELSALDEYAKYTGFKQPDEALTSSLMSTKQEIAELAKDPDYLNNPVKYAQLLKLRNRPKYMAQTLSTIKSGFEDLQSGMQATVDKNGKTVPARYSKANRLQLNKFYGLAEGQFDYQSINGTDYLVIMQEDGSYDIVDTNYLNKHGLSGTAIELFDYDTYLSDFSKNLGSVKEVKDEGNRTISVQKFNDMKPMVENRVKQLVGTKDKLTNQGISILVDHMGFDENELKNITSEQYNQLVDNIVNNVQSTYKEEVKDEANVQLINSQNTAKYQQGQLQIGRMNAETSRMNAETNAKKVNHDIRQDSQNSGGYQYVTLEGNNGVTYPLKKGFEVKYDGTNTIKANSMIVTNDNGAMRYYASDGKNTVEVNNKQVLLNEAGVNAKDVMNALNNGYNTKPEKLNW